MGLEWINSAIDGVSNLIGNVSQNISNRSLAEYQNAWNLEMWNRQNEYNSPKATMERLVEAGINPRSVNGLQTFSNGADAPQAAQYSQTSPLSAFSDIAKTALEMRSMLSVIAKNEADKVKSETQAATEQAKALDLLSQIENRSRSTDIAEDNLKLTIIDGLRRAWHEGDSLKGTGIFKTHLPELTFDQESYGISGIKRINENESIHLRNLADEELPKLRSIELYLKEDEKQFLDNIPKELQFIIKTLLMLK